MKLKYDGKLKPKIRYHKDDGGYHLKINKRFLENWLACHILKVDEDLYNDMLINECHATALRSRWGYPIYHFKLLNDAKKAVNWLRSLETINKMLE